MDDLATDPVLHRAEDDPWARRLGIVASRTDDGGVAFRLELTEEHMNFLAGGHGGVLYSLADVAFMCSAAAHGADPTGLDGHLALTAGGRVGDVFTATVEAINTGRTLGTFRVVVTRTDGRVVGHFTGTARYGAPE